MKEKILLHICCGVCCGQAVKKCQEDGYEVVGYFYNPNIRPREEYARRLQAAQQACAALGIELVEGEYDAGQWDEAVRGLENEPEGGKRCPVCFRQRISRTLEKAAELGIAHAASTLSISPHKDSAVINAIGLELGPKRFKPYDFKKQDGFKKTSDFAREHNLYRQHYCGCPYPRRLPTQSGNCPL